MIFLLLLFASPAHAILNSSVVISDREICPGIVRTEVKINNAYIETTYDIKPHITPYDFFTCTIHIDRFADPLDNGM